MIIKRPIRCLVRVGETTHTRHHAEHVVVNSVDTDLGGAGSRNSVVREDKLKGGVVNAREVAGSRWLVLLRAESERVAVDTGIRGAGVVLEWLTLVEEVPHARRSGPECCRT